MAAYTELFMDKGSTFYNVLNLTDDLTSNVISLSGYTVYSAMKKSYYTLNVAANLVCTITNVANGELTLSLDAANTAKIDQGRYFFDVKTVDSSNNVSKLIEGVIFVDGRIS